MSQATLLRQVLTTFETTRAPLSLPQLARDLAVSPEHLEGMIQYWVRKGRIRQSDAPADCGACSHAGAGCPFVLSLPRSYELAGDEAAIPLALAAVACGIRK